MNVIQEKIGTDISEDEFLDVLQGYDDIDTAIMASGLPPLMAGSTIVKIGTASSKRLIRKLITYLAWKKTCPNLFSIEESWN